MDDEHVSRSRISAKSEALMDASVVIPTKDRPLDLIRCLRALSGQQTTRYFEVIVVDDGSAPPIRRADVELFPAVRVISSGGVGPAAARNRGVSAARAPYILFTDDDTAPSPGWVESACAFLEGHSDHVGVEGPTVSPPFDPLYERSLQNCDPGAYWTCNVAYRRDTLDQLGGFAEIFQAPHGEDLDLGFRALRVGPIGFEADMEVMHYPASVTIRDIVRRTRYVSSDLILYRRHPDRFPSRLPPRLQPPLAMLRYLRGTLRRDRQAMIGTPRRLARFSLLAAGQLAVAVWTPLRHAGDPAKGGG
jgi:GT2 family glycosyltransferase